MVRIIALIFICMTIGCGEEFPLGPTTAFSDAALVGLTDAEQIDVETDQDAGVNEPDADLQDIDNNQLDSGTPDVDIIEPEPDVGEPDLSEPDLGVADLSEPDLGEPDLGEPDLGEPDLGEPDLGEPDLGVADTSVPEEDTGTGFDFGYDPVRNVVFHEDPNTTDLENFFYACINIDNTNNCIPSELVDGFYVRSVEDLPSGTYTAFFQIDGGEDNLNPSPEFTFVIP